MFPLQAIPTAFKSWAGKWWGFFLDICMARYSRLIDFHQSGNQVDLPAPDFRVVDDSSVMITSVRNSVQKSMMEQGFSSWSVEASASVICPVVPFYLVVLTRLGHLQLRRLWWV
jgi:hypothetical protein